LPPQLEQVAISASYLMGIVTVLLGTPSRVITSNRSPDPILTGSRTLNQNLPHQPGRQAEEVTAVTPPDVFPVNQPQPGLIHECGGL
jgi:hypothetical protein